MDLLWSHRSDRSADQHDRSFVVPGEPFRRLKLKLKSGIDATAIAPTSVVLQRLHDEAPTDYFTVGWLMGSLHRRSFGIIMLLLALAAMAPGVAIVAGLLLMIPALQMIAGRPAPFFPRFIADRPLPPRHLAALVQRAVPVLRYLEKVIHPRWAIPLEATAPSRRRRRDTERHLLLTPIPFTNIVPALVIAVISLAYLEEDGLLLSLALLNAVVVVTLELAAVWETVLGAKWIVGLW
jgi:hypothetical protein